MTKTILAVSIREIETKYGLKKQYSIKVRDDQGGEVWMSTFDSAIGGQVETVKSHDMADIEWEKKGNFLNIKSVKKIDAPPIEEPPAMARVSGSEQPTYETEPEDDPNRKIENKHYFCPKKNRLISRQSSLERAIQYMAAVDFGPVDKADAVRVTLELAETFYEWVNK